MIFTTSLNIPANTGQNEHTEQQIDLCYGIIRQIDISLPAGCCGLVGVKVKRSLHSLFPIGDDNWFIGDNAKISFDEQYMLLYEPYCLTLQGYNLDDTYEHNIIFRIGLELPGVTAKITNLQELSDAVF